MGSGAADQSALGGEPCLGLCRRSRQGLLAFLSRLPAAEQVQLHLCPWPPGKEAKLPGEALAVTVPRHSLLRGGEWGAPSTSRL